MTSTAVLLLCLLAPPALAGPPPLDAGVPTDAGSDATHPPGGGGAPIDAATPSASSPAATPAAAAPPKSAAPAHSNEGVSDLVPPYEVKLLGPHPVDLVKAAFRPGKGLEIRSLDGAFSLTTRVRAMFLYSIVHPSMGDTEQAFAIRRARVVFAGNAFGKHNKYKIELAISPQDMVFQGGNATRTPILDWYLDFDYLRDLTLRMGVYKVPYNRQRVISSGDLQLVDRSLGNGEFNLDRDVGIEVRSMDFLGLKHLRYYAGVYIGEGRDPFELGDLGLMYLGRVEALPLGLFDDYYEADFERTRRPRLSIGAAYAFLDEAKGIRGILGRAPRDGGTSDMHNFTADIHFKIAGFSLLSEVYWRQATRTSGGAKDAMGNPIPTEAPRDGWGVFAQAGYLFPRLPLEVAARWGTVLPLGASSLTESNELGGGLSLYVARHSLKLQADYFRLWSNDGFDKGSDQIRLQLQAAL